jgi:DNA polymerase III subunit epsilon
MLSREVAIIDVETTGTNPATDRVVQIAVRKYTSDFKPKGAALTTLVNPETTIPEEATAIHSITNEMVKSAPTFCSLARKFYEYLRGCDVAGHNIARFDVPILNEEFLRCGLAWPFLDTKIIDTYALFVKQEPRDLKAAAQFYAGIDFTDGHDAGRDVEVNGLVLEGMFKKYPEFATMTAADLDKFCFENKNVDIAGKIILNEAGVMLWNFGKYKGLPLDKSHFHYAKWFVGQPDTMTHTKNVLKGIYKGL